MRPPIICADLCLACGTGPDVTPTQKLEKENQSSPDDGVREFMRNIIVGFFFLNVKGISDDKPGYIDQDG